SFGYNFKQLFKALPLKQVRLYLTAQNLYTFTGYTGMDPEVGYAGNSWGQGIDYGQYPRPRTFLAGINIKF
ncbi:MAG: TonB-dependent receptor, partial [Tannerella sp.]|nr:TonB-dependent receptor [Tannerella sp.]